MSHIVPISMKVAATLAAYRGVTCVTGTANTCQYPAAATSRPFGITTDTVLDTTASIPVAIGGLQDLYFNDSVTSGNMVALDSSGRGVPHVDTTAGSYILGVLIGATIAATGTIAKVLIQPGFKSIP